MFRRQEKRACVQILQLTLHPGLAPRNEDPWRRGSAGLDPDQPHRRGRRSRIGSGGVLANAQPSAQSSGTTEATKSWKRLLRERTSFEFLACAVSSQGWKLYSKESSCSSCYS